jgi:D-alanine-D-alanine ligase-like ATP-grasp enzyme
MNFERNVSPKKAMNIGVEARLKEIGFEFRYTSLGDPVFVKKGATDASYGIHVRNWTVEQLRVIADYIEANPNCYLMSDGSGSDETR